MRQFGLGQQHLHVTGHAARTRVNGVADNDTFMIHYVTHFAQCVLRLDDRHAIAGHDDDR
jgi:hypothetical protein